MVRGVNSIVSVDGAVFNIDAKQLCVIQFSDTKWELNVLFWSPL